MIQFLIKTLAVAGVLSVPAHAAVLAHYINSSSSTQGSSSTLSNTITSLPTGITVSALSEVGDPSGQSGPLRNDIAGSSNDPETPAGEFDYFAANRANQFANTHTATNDYWAFNLGNDSGATLDLLGLSFDHFSTLANSLSLQVYASTDNINFTAIGSPVANATANNLANASILFDAASGFDTLDNGGTLYIRVNAASPLSDSGSQFMMFNDLMLTAEPVPEPSVALATLAGLGLMLRRRR